MLTYDLDEMQKFIDSVPVEEREIARRNYRDHLLECYIKASFGYNRNYDFPTWFVAWLSTKPKSFVLSLKKQYCEHQLETFQNLIFVHSEEKNKYIIKYPKLKQALEEVYSRIFHDLYSSINRFKHRLMTLETDYTPSKKQFTEAEIETASTVDLSFLFDKKRRSGKNWIVLCPFHNEKTPSMVLFFEKGFHCFGCGAHGSSIDLFMKINGCNFSNAIKQLLELR